MTKLFYLMMAVLVIVAAAMIFRTDHSEKVVSHNEIVVSKTIKNKDGSVIRISEAVSPPDEDLRRAEEKMFSERRNPVVNDGNAEFEPRKCEIQECHGLDISCGFSQENKVCTAMYRLGDYCRVFAGCDFMEGQCHVVMSDKFESCKECVSKCDALSGQSAFDCEGRCREQFPSR